MNFKEGKKSKDKNNKQKMNGTLENTARVSLSKRKNRAFIAAYDQWAEKLFRFAYYKVSSRELAQDLVSQAFLKTWDYLGRGNEVRDWRLFLYRTLKNLVIDYYRSRDLKETAMLSDFVKNTVFDEKILPARLNNNLEAKLILEEFASLAPEAAEILELRYIEGFSVKDIAKLVGKSPNAVYVNIHRSLKKLSEIYKQNNDELA